MLHGPSETLVLYNYGPLVEKVQDAIRQALAAKVILKWDNNVVRELRGLCKGDQFGLNPTDFTTTDGATPLKQDRAFAGMINQFFCDMDCVKRIFQDVETELSQNAK
ncbi:Uncharacterised protein [Candidatus Burarchaeum australiense]|nr:Uncharacterised protein [Candidatus Burarchaeum australiense]